MTFAAVENHFQKFRRDSLMNVTPKVIQQPLWVARVGGGRKRGEPFTARSSHKRFSHTFSVTHQAVTDALGERQELSYPP